MVPLVLTKCKVQEALCTLMATDTNLHAVGLKLNQLNMQRMRNVSDRVHISAYTVSGVSRLSQSFKQSVNPDCTPSLDAASPVRQQHAGQTSTVVCQIILERKNPKNS